MYKDTVLRNVQYSLHLFKLKISRGIEPLGESYFAECCKINVQVDSGVNIWTVIIKNLLVFLMPKITKLNNVNGGTFESEGYGAVLGKIGTKLTTLVFYY